MKRTKGRMTICWGLLVFLLIFIWGNSAMPAEMSSRFSDWVRDILLQVFPGNGENPGEGTHLLRKMAHFLEFACLGACLGWLHSMVNQKAVYALAWGTAAACMDETIQHFSPGRAPGIRDVAIDTAGVAVGIGLLLTGYYLLRKRKNNLFLEENKI